MKQAFDFEVNEEGWQDGNDNRFVFPKINRKHFWMVLGGVAFFLYGYVYLIGMPGWMESIGQWLLIIFIVWLFVAMDAVIGLAPLASVKNTSDILDELRKMREEMKNK